jgi:hypothetical protein
MFSLWRQAVLYFSIHFSIHGYRSTHVYKNFCKNTPKQTRAHACTVAALQSCTTSKTVSQPQQPTIAPFLQQANRNQRAYSTVFSGQEVCWLTPQKYARTNTHTCTRTCMYMHMRLHMHTDTRTCIRTWTRARIHAHTLTHRSAHMHKTHGHSAYKHTHTLSLAHSPACLIFERTGSRMMQAGNYK